MTAITIISSTRVKPRRYDRHTRIGFSVGRPRSAGRRGNLASQRERSADDAHDQVVLLLLGLLDLWGLHESIVVEAHERELRVPRVVGLQRDQRTMRAVVFDLPPQPVELVVAVPLLEPLAPLA